MLIMCKLVNWCRMVKEQHFAVFGIQNTRQTCQQDRQTTFYKVCFYKLYYNCLPLFSFYQVCLTFGALILFAGLIVILVGYTTPARIEAFGEDDLLFVDR